MDNSSYQSLKSRSLIVLTSQVIKLSIQVTAIVIFSRLLSPEVFGLYAMVAVFVALAELMRDFGLSTTALSTHRISQQSASNMFWLNLIQGVVACAVIAALSPFCAAVFSQPILTQLQPVLAINLLINGFQIQFQVHLAKRGKILVLAMTDILAPLVGLIAGLASYFSGLGFWSLAVQSLVTPTTLALSRLLASEWRPSLPKNLRFENGFLDHSWKYGFGHLASYLMRNVDNFMIGLIWGPLNLGIYARAYQLQTLPLVGALAPLTTVIVPKLVEDGEDNSSPQLSLHRLQFVIGLSGCFLFGLAGSTASMILPWLLGENWEGSAKIFLILAIAGMFETLSVVNYWRFLSTNQGGKFLMTNLISGSIGILFVIVASLFGVTAVAVAVVVNQIMHWSIAIVIQNNYFGKSDLKFGSQGIAIAFSGSLALASSYYLQSFLTKLNYPVLGILTLQTASVTAVILICAFSFKGTRPQFLFFLENSLRRSKQKGNRGKQI